MKALLVGESREGVIQESFYELVGFANKLNLETSMFLVGKESSLPTIDGLLYLADSEKYGDYNPSIHKQLLLDTIDKEKPDYIVFSHSTYGWDLAPRIAVSQQISQVSEIIAVENNEFIVPACNSKLRRKVKPSSDVVLLTLQGGAFNAPDERSGSPEIISIDTPETKGPIDLKGYELAAATGVDLSKAEVIVCAGRGVGKKENIAIVEQLAKSLGGEIGGSRPVIDAGWLDSSLQVGVTGTTVSPKLYVACGISGAVQHIVGMKKSDFIVAINTDRDAPITDVADVLVEKDLKEFIPILVEKLGK